MYHAAVRNAFFKGHGLGNDYLAVDPAELDFKITPYSLNTKLSFKFDSLAHFVEFLRLHDVAWIEEKNAALQSTLNELGLDPNEFFYVNFFEKDKEIQM